MRLFFAINLPQTVKNTLSKELPRFSYLKFRQIPPENWHLTLKFIGEPDGLGASAESILEKIDESLELLPERFQTFDLMVQDVGFLNKRIFAFNLEWSNRLFALFKFIEERLASRQIVAIDRERFHPHITVGRKNPPVRSELHSLRHFELKTREQLSFQVKSVDLMESTLTPDGAIYKVIKQYQL
jgi:2'-5' RNA ligase